tara:strand:- start:419 stop:571 length:153 start_codon:yes stop_codon:yes gene_type:complete
MKLFGGFNTTSQAPDLAIFAGGYERESDTEAAWPLYFLPVAQDSIFDLKK